MDEWFEVEVKTWNGWARLGKAPLVIHGGLVAPEVRQFRTVQAAGDARAAEYPDATIRIMRCRKDGTEEPV